jgi:hypothetical protein
VNDFPDHPHAGRSTNGSGPPQMPDWLRTALAGLKDGERNTLTGPWDSEIQPRLGTDLAVMLLLDRGLTTEQVTEAAPLFPNGLGLLRDYPGGLGILIRELCDERDAASAALKAARKARAEAAAKLFDPWADQKPPSWLSRDHEETIAHLCLRDGLDFGAQALAYIAAASGAAPKNARFAPYRHSGWSVPPIVWIMLIADSGQRKTALLNNAFLGLRKINGVHWDDYDEVYARWNAMPDTAEKKAHGKPREPHSYIVQDTSPEALQIILAGNDRGTLLLKDELASLFDFGRYSSGTGGSERAFYLESYGTCQRL